MKNEIAPEILAVIGAALLRKRRAGAGPYGAISVQLSSHQPRRLKKGLFERRPREGKQGK